MLTTQRPQGRHKKTGKEIPDYFSSGEENEDEIFIKGRKLSSGLVYFAYLLTAVIFLVILFTFRSPDLRFNNERVGRLTGTWRVSYMEGDSGRTAGKSETVSLPFGRKVPAGETVIWSIILPESRTATGLLYNSIMFRAFHEYVKVYLDGELLYEFGYDQSVAFSDAPNNGWLIVRLPNDFAGKVLSIEKKGYYDGFAGTLHDVYLGTKNALVFYVLHSCLPQLSVNFCIIILSLCILISSFFFKRKYMVYQLRYLSAFSMITSIWLILESGGYQLFAGKPVIVSNLLFLFFSLIPLVLIRFLLTYESFQNSRYMNFLLRCAFGCFLLVHVLQLTGTVNYLKSIFLTHAMLVLAILGIIGRYVKMRIKKEKMENLYLFISCFVFGIFALIDLIRFYLVNPSRPALFSQLGFFFYFVILCCFAIHKIVKDNEESMSRIFFQQMAYTDLLTGLPNRNAFEREMEYYRREKELRPTIMVMDLNGLKNINDSFGHSQGDNAIVHVGHSLRECFSGKGHVFRIGGDEFCAIFQDVDIETMKKEIDDFKNRIQKEAEEIKLPLSVAVGWAETETASDITDIFNSADACMYKDKKKIKEMRDKEFK